MPKLVLVRGDISPLDELVIVLSEPDNEQPPYSSTGLQPRLSRRLWPSRHGQQDHRDRRQGRRTARTTQSTAAVGIGRSEPLVP